jgi:hypothetical protein
MFQKERTRNTNYGKLLMPVTTEQIFLSGYNFVKKFFLMCYYSKSKFSSILKRSQAFKDPSRHDNGCSVKVTKKQKLF